MKDFLGLKVLVMGESTKVFTVIDQRETGVYLADHGWEPLEKVYAIPKEVEVNTITNEFVSSEDCQVIFDYGKNLKQ
jgi:hypothetical protein